MTGIAPSAVREQLDGIDLVALRAEQWSAGRGAVSPAFLNRAHRLHRFAIDGQGDRSLLRYRQQLELLEAVTAGLAMLRSGRRPVYQSYTNLQPIDWYLAPFASNETLKAKAVIGIFHLLASLARFEGDSLVGLCREQTASMKREVVVNRLEALSAAIDDVRRLADLTPGAALDAGYATPPRATLAAYCAEPSRLSAMLHFTAMPMTSFHDELLFLRAIHAAELCFFALRVCVIELRQQFEAGEPTGAAVPARQAVGFARMLHRVFKVLRTMPVEHFADFRDATGDASAVQSRNYQLLDVFLRGVDPRKRDVLRRIPHLRELLQYAHPGFASLASTLRSPAASESRWAEVMELARELDKQLLTWRGLHLAFARAYLPADMQGTGGTHGASYLQQFLRSGMFQETSPDLAAIEVEFPQLLEWGDCARAHSPFLVGPPSPKEVNE